MEEVFKRENEQMVKIIQHEEKLLTNQEVYNHWIKLSTEEMQKNQEMRKIQAKLDQIRERKKEIKDICMECEKYLDKEDDKEVKIIEPSEVDEK